MTDAPRQPATKRIPERLAGQRILITGSTGFLAKALVEKLLRSIDTIESIHLLVRPRGDGLSPAERVSQELFRSRAFDRLRAALGDRFSSLCKEKVRVVGGDLTQERLGLSEAAYLELTRRVTMVINSAATVTFDERLDHAIELNTKGPQRLLQFAKDCDNVPFLHVSTCYVCGARRGTIVEDFSAPEPARETLPRLAGDGAYDLGALVDGLLADAKQVRLRMGADTESCRRELIDEGMRAARRHGWNDTYTFTKWIGEQLLVRDHERVPLTVFRPAIIESGYDEPMPGWIDGLRMADPIIVAYGKGKLNEFPGRPDVTIDFIPVDFVVNGMITALATQNGSAGVNSSPVEDARSTNGRNRHTPSVRVFQCASSDRKPLQVGTLANLLERAFLSRPMRGDDGKPVHPRPLSFVDQREFLRKWQEKHAAVEKKIAWLHRLHVGATLVRKLTAMARQIEQIIYFAKIYAPYTQLDCRFAEDNLARLRESLNPEDRAEFPCDPASIDWQDYIVNRHVPGLRSFVLNGAADLAPRIAGMPIAESAAETPIPGIGKNLFAAFQQTAIRFKHKAALQVRRDGRWVVYTYDDVLAATGAIMRRLDERGLRLGDAVAICAENSPEWGLTYLALMRAGLTAVPLDPQLPPGEVVAAARFADAKLLCAGRTTFDRLHNASEFIDLPVVAMTEPWVPAPGAARDTWPAAVDVEPANIASILFTSGTTLDPKAVPLTHANLLANARALLNIHPLSAADEFLSVLPMYHAFEFTGGFLVPMLLGATVTYVEQLKGAEITSAMQATGTTIMLVVPRLLRSFQDSIEAGVASAGVLRRSLYRLLMLVSRMTKGQYGRHLFRPVHRNFGGRLRMLVSGGAALDSDLFEAFRLIGLPVYEGYGLTETSPVLTVARPGSCKPSAVGAPLPNVELEVRNQNLEGVGEIWVRGPNVMSGYLKNPTATNEVMVDGWFRTGDLGRRDEDGDVFLTGRSKDLIITDAGKNVYPDEVEFRYRDLPHVKEICVFGVSSGAVLGDTVQAVAVIDAASLTTLDRSTVEREIRSAAETIGERLPAHQRILHFHFWEREFPKTSTLKAKRTLIRDIVRGERPTPHVTQAPSAANEKSDVKPVANPTAFAELKRIIARQGAQTESAIHSHSHLLLDLGIDSIGKIDLVGAVEGAFDIHIDDPTAARIARVEDLLRLIGDRSPVGSASRAAGAFKRLVGTSMPSSANGHVAPALLPARWFARGAVGTLMRTYVRVRSRGRENVPKSGPFILAANHSSHLDSPAVLTALAGRRRAYTAGAADYFFTTPAKRFVFGRLFDTIPFDRNEDGLSGLQRCAEVLRRGDGVLIFPEGTRSRTGQMQPFKVGVCVLAVEQQVPIIPVHIHRAYNLLPKGNRLARPGVITVTFGSPIWASSDADAADPYTTFRAMTRQLEKSVLRLAEAASPK